MCICKVYKAINIQSTQFDKKDQLLGRMETTKITNYFYFKNYWLVVDGRELELE